MKYAQDNHRKIVLTGGPCCGKTTTLDALRKKGHKVLPETAREVIQEGIYHPSLSVEDFQNEILRRQVEREQELEGLNFLDRGALDGIAYSLIFLGRVPEFFKDHNFMGRYGRVFVLDRFSLVNDGVRVEGNDEEAGIVHDRIHRVYFEHGYNPIRVPIMPVEERVDFILNHIQIDERRCE